jgi:regulator of replication initiation timing
MAQVSLRIGKLKSGSLGAAENHNQRNEISENIILQNTHLNQKLVGGHRLLSDVMNRLNENSITIARGKQNESTVAIEIILSASPEFFRDNPEERGVFDQRKMEQWRDANLDFLQRRFGENLVRLDLHLDETTPHMHAIVTPIMRQERKIRRTQAEIRAKTPAKTKIVSVLNASKMFNKNALIQLQTDAAEAVSHLGIERGIRNSKADHTTLKNWYKTRPTIQKIQENIETLSRQREFIFNQGRSEYKDLLEKRDEHAKITELIKEAKWLKDEIKKLKSEHRTLKMENAKLAPELEASRKIINTIEQVSRMKNPHAYIQEQRIKRLESIISAFKSKFGPLHDNDEKHDAMGHTGPKNPTFPR